MVTQSKPWLELADAAGLARKSVRRGVKIGLVIALEQQADADDSTAVAIAIQRETKTIIEAAILSAKNKQQREMLEAVLQQFDHGETTNDQARGIVETLQGE